MNNLTLQNSMQFANVIEKEINQALKQLFKDKINGSFLIKIKKSVIADLGDNLFRLMPFQTSDSWMVTGDSATYEYDICRMIVGTHRHHTVFLSKSEIKNKQNDPTYIKMLVDEVIEKIHLHSLSNSYFSKKQLFPGEEFHYYPVPYELFAMCARYIAIATRNSKSLFIFHRDVIDNALAILKLMENNLLSNAYPLCRVMIEQYFKVLILEKHPECVDAYSDFRAFEIDQSCCSQEYPKEFNQLYETRKLQSYKNKVDYLHYGWLDSIPKYTATHSKYYTLYGIIEYLEKTLDDRLCNNIRHLTKLYKECHGYTHGSSNHVKYPLLNYFELCLMLYFVVKDMFINLHKNAAIEISDFDQCLMAQLKRDFEVLCGQYEEKSTEKFKMYYGE